MFNAKGREPTISPLTAYWLLLFGKKGKRMNWKVVVAAAVAALAVVLKELDDD